MRCSDGLVEMQAGVMDSLNVYAVMLEANPKTDNRISTISSNVAMQGRWKIL
jgi:hypothetical protein